MAADLKAIQTIKQALEKKYKASTELFPDFKSKKKIEVVPTSSAILNAITVVGGFPKGRVTEIYGPESTGKTTIGILASAEALKLYPNLAVLYLDYEHAFDAMYAHKLGLDVVSDRFIFAQPDYFEQGEQIVYDYVAKVNSQGWNPMDLLSLVVVDSAAAMTPWDILTAKAEQSQRIGLQAALMARLLDRSTKFISRGTKPAMVILNQTRAKIDVNNTRNSGEDSAGGKALRFYSTCRIELEVIKREGEENRSKDPSRGSDQVYTQHRVRATAVKNKVGVPWVRGSLVFEFGKGINNILSIAELAETKLGIMSGSGFFRYDGDKAETSFSCRGREVFQEELAKNPALCNELERKVIQAIEADYAQAIGLKGGIQVSGDAKEIEADITLEDERPTPGAGNGAPGPKAGTVNYTGPMMPATEV